MPSIESQQIRATFMDDTASIHTPVEIQRREWEESAAKIPLQPGIKVESTLADGIPCEWVRATDVTSDPVLMWLHGGGFSTGSCITHRDFASRLSIALGLPVLNVDYRLVPEHPFPAGLNDAVAVYRWLLKTGYAPNNIILGGDSSGGGLATSALLMLREAGDPLPTKAILLSPMLDMTLTGTSFNSRAGIDPLISQIGLEAAVKLYTADHDPKHPLLSPIYADLRGLPPLLIQAGNDELLLDDAVRLAERAKTAGVEVELEVWSEMWHFFQAWVAELPEAQEAIRKIATYIKQS